MYQDYYGLHDLPFELTPNPRYLFLTPRHQEALSNLQYGLFSAKSLTVLVGEAGTGKTTLLRAALESDLCRGVRCVYVNNPTLTRDEFVTTLAMRFGLGTSAMTSKALLLGELERVLADRRARGEIAALVVDEAQGLTTELLEEVRLLTNIETSSEKLLPLVLAGQPELGARLNEPSLRQLKQRVALQCEIPPFELSETAAYIASRIKVAGGQAVKLFTREAVATIHERSGGIPRTINVLCDNALVTGMALGKRPVDRSIVLDVCHDFRLDREPIRAYRAAAVAPALVDEEPRSGQGERAPDEGGAPMAEREMFGQVSRRGRFALFRPGQ